MADTGGLGVATEVDPRKKLPPIFDQGQLGSCTANATAACFQYDSILDGKDCGVLSRLWIYYFERAIEHALDQGDCGAMGHDAFTVAKHGVPAEKLWPYDIGRFEAKPPAAEPRAYTLSKTVRAVPQSQSAIKQVLSNGQTIAFGFTVYESFESAHTARTGIVPMPKAGEEVLGGHETLIVGYLKAHPTYALVRNSWGTGWGLGGYYLMPWSYLTNTELSSDLRTIVRPT
jgi:C1A family cysteine protease